MYVKDTSSLYKEIQVKTANQGKLIVMLYDGAIKFLNIAASNIPKKKYDIANTNITKTQDILTELMLSLNFEAKDIASKLYSLYSYMNKRLLEGNIKKDVKPIKEVIRYLSELKIAWEQIAHLPYEGKDPEKTSGLNIKS